MDGLLTSTIRSSIRDSSFLVSNACLPFSLAASSNRLFVSIQGLEMSDARRIINHADLLSRWSVR